MRQYTIKEIITFSGIGLHSGTNVNVRIMPSVENTGIVFIRKDVAGSPRIKATADNVIATNYATTLGVRGANVSTVEHLLAAFYGLGIDNAIVELDGPEVPVLDGSAAHFIEMLENAGFKAQHALKKYLVIKKPIKVSEGDKYVLIQPSADMDFSIDYSIDFAHPFVARQSFSSQFSRDIFKDEVASARTFGFLNEVEALRANGLARGGSLNNAVVISDTRILNEGGLRYPDEFVRHKVLDMMGDISLAGMPIIGCVAAHRSGHALNFKLVQQILRKRDCWEVSDSLEREESKSFFLENSAPALV